MLPDWAQTGLFILLIWVTAWIISLLVPFVSRLMLWLFGQDSRNNLERRLTLTGLLNGLLRMLIVILAILSTLALFADIDSLIWLVGLFAAGFGLGARPFISDVLTGLTFIYDRTFDVGEKIEILDTIGVVESVGLRTTHLRAPSGELFVLPNGDIRMIRNFSRGKFSRLTIRLDTPAANIDQAMAILRRLGREVLVLVPDVIEQWFVTSEGELTDKIQLVIVAKTRFGRAADNKPHLEALIHQRLKEADIHATKTSSTAL
ncbi:MAG: mechanosensitive ion channel [Ardenticatenaceae bacterium]|nr:mechanosensitive ion channel [Ardenticatenaceae bacterium]